VRAAIFRREIILWIHYDGNSQRFCRLNQRLRVLMRLCYQSGRAPDLGHSRLSFNGMRLKFSDCTLGRKAFFELQTRNNCLLYD